jgi:hypothetical protein
MQKVCQFSLYVEFTNYSYIALNYCCNIDTRQKWPDYLEGLN